MSHAEPPKCYSTGPICFTEAYAGELESNLFFHISVLPLVYYGTQGSRQRASETSPIQALTGIRLVELQYNQYPQGFLESGFMSLPSPSPLVTGRGLEAFLSYKFNGTPGSFPCLGAFDMEL